MAQENAEQRITGSVRVKRGLAEMLKGGVIMDVVTPDQAKVAEDAGAVAVMALERVPADIRADGGISRMSDPEMIEGIQAAVTIPVMAKARIGHFVEAQILQALGVDYIDESEVLSPADEKHHIAKHDFTVPFVCGATNLGEALRRISEGACMIRSKGEAGTGDVIQAVRHLRSIIGDIKKITQADDAELFEWAKQLQAPLPLVEEIAETGWLQVPLFCAGGLATPADAALAMQLGAEAVFVGSGIFKSADPAPRAKAIVEATTNFTGASFCRTVGLYNSLPPIRNDKITSVRLHGNAKVRLCDNTNMRPFCRDVVTSEGHLGPYLNNKVSALRVYTGYLPPKKQACLFDGANYGGQYLCFGVGTYSLPPAAQNKATSVLVGGGATARLSKNLPYVGGGYVVNSNINVLPPFWNNQIRSLRVQ